jgi:hypothetical protein
MEGNQRSDRDQGRGRKAGGCAWSRRLQVRLGALRAACERPTCGTQERPTCWKAFTARRSASTMTPCAAGGEKPADAPADAPAEKPADAPAEAPEAPAEAPKSASRVWSDPSCHPLCGLPTTTLEAMMKPGHDGRAACVHMCVRALEPHASCMMHAARVLHDAAACGCPGAACAGGCVHALKPPGLMQHLEASVRMALSHESLGTMHAKAGPPSCWGGLHGCKIVAVVLPRLVHAPRLSPKPATRTSRVALGSNRT